MGTLYHERLNAQRGIRTQITLDAETGLPIIAATQNIAPIIEANRQAANDFDRLAVRGGHARWRRIASIPNVIIEQLTQRGIMRGNTVLDEKKFLQFLSDPDNRYFRTDGGGRLV